MIPFCLHTAAEDPNVRGCLALYVKLFSMLDFVHYRPAKRVVLSRALGLTEPRISQALETLVLWGYLDPGPADAVAPYSRTYRLAVSPVAVERVRVVPVNKAAGLAAR